MDAIDDLSDAIDVTREFLTPARPGLWLRLAVIVFFVSSFGFGAPSVPTGDTTVQDDGTQDFEEEWETETGEQVSWEDLLLGLLIVGLVILVLWLAYALIAAIMEFVFLESIRSSEVHVRRYFRDHLGLGLRLFGFRLGVTILGGLLVLVPGYLLVASAGGLNEVTGLGFLAVLLLGAGVFFVYYLVDRFTTDFVAPVMLHEGRGVLSAWSRFWSAFTGNLAEYVVYLVLVWILGLVVSIAASFVIAMVGFVLAIPFIVLFVLLFVTLGNLAVAPAILLGLLGLVAFLLLVSLVWVPVVTYFRYYALLLLGDTDRELDLIPEQRAAARGDGGRTDAGADAWAGGDDEWTTDDGRVDDESASEFDWGPTEDETDNWNAEDRDADPDDEDDRDRGW